MAIQGRSNGGLLVRPVWSKGPNPFGAVICAGKRICCATTNGRWAVIGFPEYGNAEENPEHFAFLYRYSPLHNVKPAKLSRHVGCDGGGGLIGRVPGHAFKFTAALQEGQQGVGTNSAAGGQKIGPRAW